MSGKKHTDSTLIDSVGTKIVCQHFGLKPQGLWAWRTRGIPALKRIAFAKLCADHCVTPPPDFFQQFEIGDAA